MKVGTQLKVWRERRALTLRELAAAAGIATTTVLRAEQDYPVFPQTARKLAAALRIDVGELVELQR